MCVCVRACVFVCVIVRTLIQNHSSSVSPNPLQTVHPDTTAMADWALNKHCIC